MKLNPAVLLLLTVVLPGVAFAQQATIVDAPQSDRRVAYTIDASLNVDARTVRGTERIVWRNPDAVDVDTLQFHLYLNAFRDGSTFMRESGGAHRGFEVTGDTGGVIIEHIRIVSPDAGKLSPQAPDSDLDLTDLLTFIQPDDDNVDDRTVAMVVLPEPVPPGETIMLEIGFEAVLPGIIARTGWIEKPDGSPFFMVAQWFPKLGVYETPGQRYVPQDAVRGQWNTHQFHANSEFYADFGTYDVTLDVPEDFVIGATGVRTDARVADGRKVVTYRAEDVHDFAWTASPVFMEFKDSWRHVSLRLLIQPEHKAQAQRHFDAVKIALEQTDDLLGVYPYTTLTLVDGLGGANGMEYPTLITCGTVVGLPSWLRMLELVTVHEFVHQYFYGMLASNEFEEAWLDEGMTSYVETRIMDEAFGPGSVLGIPGLRIDDGPSQRLAYVRSSPGRGALFTRSWEYEVASDYGKASYWKSSTVMHTLDGYLGEATMREFLRTYYHRWRFRHPTTRDLQQVAEEVSGEDLDWFFEQYVYGTAVVDYAVDTVEVTRDSTGVTSLVRVRRLRDGVFPQTLEVRFEDGASERVAWDGEAASKAFMFEHGTPVGEAFLDPENAIWLDINRLNNRQSLAPSTVFQLKYLFKTSTWMQLVLHVLGAFL